MEKFGFFVLSFIFATTLASPVEIAFSGNVSLSNNSQNQTLAFREVVADFFSVEAFGFNAFLSEAGQVTATAGQANLDLVAAGFVTLLTHYPQGFVAWFDAKAKYTTINSVNADNISTTIVEALAAAGGLAGIGYVGLQEIDPNGNVVATVDFKSINFDQSSGAVETDATGNIQFGWIANTPTNSKPASYNFTVLHSAVLGQLPYGAIVTPKSYDVILAINNYPYANAANQLQLTYVAAYGVANFTGSAVLDPIKKSVTYGSGANQVYISGAASATISGSSVSVHISASALATISSDIAKQIDFFANFIQTTFSSSSGASVFNVTFPAGATNIIYDPVSGFEQPITSSCGFNSTSANSTSANSTNECNAGSCIDNACSCDYGYYGANCQYTCIFDACLVCNGNGFSCAGCDGVPNSGKLLDYCGVCGGDNSTCKGCDGIPNSNTQLDDCGVCGGNGSSCAIQQYCDGLQTCVQCNVLIGANEVRNCVWCKLTDSCIDINLQSQCTNALVFNNCVTPNTTSTPSNTTSTPSNTTSTPTTKSEATSLSVVFSSSMIMTVVLGLLHIY